MKTLLLQVRTSKRLITLRESQPITSYKPKYQICLPAERSVVSRAMGPSCLCVCSVTCRLIVFLTPCAMTQLASPFFTSPPCLSLNTLLAFTLRDPWRYLKYAYRSRNADPDFLDAIAAQRGIRWSALNILTYWSSSNSIVEFMHTAYLCESLFKFIVMFYYMHLAGITKHISNVNLLQHGMFLVPVLVKVAKSDPQNNEELKCSSCRGYSWDQNEPGISKFGGQVNEIQAKYKIFTIMACKNQRHL